MNDSLVRHWILLQSTSRQAAAAMSGRCATERSDNPKHQNTKTPRFHQHENPSEVLALGESHGDFRQKDTFTQVLSLAIVRTELSERENLSEGAFLAKVTVTFASARTRLAECERRFRQRSS